MNANVNNGRTDSFSERNVTNALRQMARQNS